MGPIHPVWANGAYLWRNGLHFIEACSVADIAACKFMSAQECGLLCVANAACYSYIPNHGDIFCHKHPKIRLKLDYKSPFGVRRGLKMIVSHRAPSSLNMSSYRAIWTHFRPNFIFFDQKIWDPGQQDFPKMQISSSSHSHKYLTYMGRWISKS